MGAALFAAVPVTIGEGVSIYQGWHYGRRDQEWSRLNFEMDSQGMRMDLVGTIREEIRDQIQVAVSTLDNMMVVATLLLSIGFAFASEMTSPPPCSPCTSIEKYLHFTYTLFCALSLVLPFWCLMFTLRIRYEVDHVMKRNVRELQGVLVKILNEKTIASAQNRRAAAPRTFSRGRAGRHGRRTWLNDFGRKAMEVHTADDLRLQEEEVAEVARWVEEDLMSNIKSYNFYYPLAQTFLWLGMLSVVVTCSVLHSLHLADTYQEEPWLWQTYAFIVTFSAVIGVIFMAFLWTSGVVSPAAMSPPSKIGSPRFDSPIDCRTSSQPIFGSAWQESEPLNKCSSEMYGGTDK